MSKLKIGFLIVLAIFVVPATLAGMNVLYKVILYQGVHMLPWSWRIK